MQKVQYLWRFIELLGLPADSNFFKCQRDEFNPSGYQQEIYDWQTETKILIFNINDCKFPLMRENWPYRIYFQLIFFISFRRKLSLKWVEGISCEVFSPLKTIKSNFNKKFLKNNFITSNKNYNNENLTSQNLFVHFCFPDNIF